MEARTPDGRHHHAFHSVWVLDAILLGVALIDLQSLRGNPHFPRVLGLRCLCADGPPFDGRGLHVAFGPARRHVRHHERRLVLPDVAQLADGRVARGLHDHRSCQGLESESTAPEARLAECAVALGYRLRVVLRVGRERGNRHRDRFHHPGPRPTHVGSHDRV